MIEFGSELLRDLTVATGREWLETNGLGGYASSSVIGLNTRRYHGLLVASLRPPVERFVLLSKVDETLVVGGERYELSVNRYPGTVHPQGYRFLERFRLDPFPRFTYRAGPVVVEKSVGVVYGENTVVLRYELLEGPAGAEIRLEVRPLIAFRDYHSLTSENGGLDPGLDMRPGRIGIHPYSGLPALYFAHDAPEVDGSGFWYRKFEYEAERERGQDFQEDLFNAFTLSYDLRREGHASLIASITDHQAAEAPELLKQEVRRRQAIAAMAPRSDSLVHSLTQAADQFIVARRGGKTVIAGYPWFADWGRDTMIALPGLTLTTGRPDLAKSILTEFARHVDQGMLPNRFADAGETAEYNTVDATLWYFEAARALAQATGDSDFIRSELFETFATIIDWHIAGSRHGIRMDTDGLLHAGEPGVQLTWMDAKIGDWVVTPRIGKPVEIQALWYHALKVMEEWAEQFGNDARARTYGNLARKASRSFNSQFWNADAGCLYDVVTPGGPDASIRPNQVLALSLRHTMVTRPRAKQVLEVVQRHLLTPCGLRSLSPEDPNYSGVYAGDPRTRDSRYHQGTVWAWLMGPFLTAYVRANGGSTASRAQAAEWLAPFRAHLREAGLGQISEIFDGDPPHTPRGCFAQAWSVAEVLRAAVEDVLVADPKAR